MSQTSKTRPQSTPDGTSLTVAQAEAGSNLTLQGSLVVEIGGETYTLSGTVGDDLIVKFDKPFPAGANLGPILSIAPAVASALGAPGLADSVTKEIDALANANIPILSGVIKVLKTAPVQITYLEINTKTSTYGFGFALDFRNLDISAGDIKLDAFGLRVTYVKTSS